MKVKRNSLINKKGQLDIKSAKQIFQSSNEFVRNLYKIMAIPTNELDERDDDDESLLPNVKHVKLKVFGDGTRAKSLEELHRKFETLKGKRKTYRDKLQMKGLKNRIKRKKEDKKLKKLKKNVKKLEPGSEFKPNREILISKLPKPIYNSEGKMVFSKFDFTDGNSTNGASAKTFSADPKATLKKLQRENDRIKKLEEHGEIEKVQAMKESAAWKKAFDMAEGKKIKDNPTLLAKSIKKIKARKEHTKRKWENIEKTKEKNQDMKQKKRAENIEARKKQVKKKKMKKLVKKGRAIMN